MVGIVVVSETRLYREGLSRALADEQSFEIVGTAADLATAIALIARLCPLPDVVLLDHAIPEGAGAVRDLQRASPGLRVLAIAVREVENDVIPWAEAGTAGFLPHDASFDDLINGLTAVAGGAGLCSPRVAAVLLKRLVALSGKEDRAPVLAELTQRERDVALLIEEGLSNKEIALRLRIQVATVKNHVHSILEKLDVRRRGEAASMVRAGAGSSARVTKI